MSDLHRVYRVTWFGSGVLMSGRERTGPGKEWRNLPDLTRDCVRAGLTKRDGFRIESRLVSEWEVADE